MKVFPEHHAINCHACHEDPSLSWKAVGLLLYLLTARYPNQFSAVLLARLHTDGRTSVESGLRELTDAGYVRINEETSNCFVSGKPLSGSKWAEILGGDR